MKHALSDDALAEIGSFLQDRPLLAFDIDGTLSPIVAHPAEARLPEDIQQRLGSLSARTDVAIITGRAIVDARRMLTFVPRYLVGSHGAEGVPGFETSAAAFAEACRGWRQALCADRDLWHVMPDLTLEDKEYSLAIHYRHARDPDVARRLLEERAARLSPPPRLVHGKCVINLLPATAPNKGDALRALLAQSGHTRALYVGDDVTDEDVFRLKLPAVLSVRIEPQAASAAGYYLNCQDEVLSFMRALEAMLPAGLPPPASPRRAFP